MVLMLPAVVGCGASASGGSSATLAGDVGQGDTSALADGQSTDSGDAAGDPDSTPTADASSDTAVVDRTDVAADPPCPSGKMWTKGTQGSASMQPGVACIACHNKSGGEAPSFAVAGTIFPSKHAIDKCYGQTGVTVEIIGSDGVVTKLITNGAGNFFQSKFTSKIVLPYTAKVYNAAGDYLEMTSPQTNGDCNSCHTVDGINGPSGRIVAPP